MSDTNVMEFDNDMKFCNELHDFVKTIPAKSKESNDSYNEKMQFLESIYDDIRITNPKFRRIPVNEEPEETPKGKYCDVVYGIAARDSSFSS